MKYKKIVFFFFIALPISVIMRLIQLWFTVETQTGFFKQEFENYGNIMLAVIFAAAFLSVIFAFASHRSPDHPPKNNIVLSLASFFVAATILLEIFIESFPLGVKGWQIALLKASGVLTSAFFVAFGAKRFVDFKLPDVCSIVPTVYLILRIICDFTSISALALISDNIILIAAYCSSLIFMLQFAKLYNKVGNERNFKKLLASGFAAIIFCLTQALPHIIVNLINGYSYLHTSVWANLSVLAIGIFVLVFVFSHFSYANTQEDAQ